MARLSDANLVIAREIMARYPEVRSALIPLCHLAQSQDGWLTEDAMAHIAELLDITAAEVLGTASFYEMFKLEPVGTYLVNICTQVPCMLAGADELLEHASAKLGVHPGQTTSDGLFTLENVECIAACTEAPCLQVNYRYFHRIAHDEFDQLVDDLRSRGVTDVPTRSNDSGEIPPHGTLARVRQQLPASRAGNVSPTDGSEPAWLRVQGSA